MGKITSILFQGHGQERERLLQVYFTVMVKGGKDCHVVFGLVLSCLVLSCLVKGTEHLVLFEAAGGETSGTMSFQSLLGESHNR